MAHYLLFHDTYADCSAVFGFPASPELPLTGLNLGLLDQRLALQWVQKHIAAFGGSPNKVTIFGESAGAEDIDALLTSYGASATPPFRAAILESGQISYRPFQFGNNTPAWNMLSSALNCPGSYKSDLACVRAASVTDIKTAINQNGLTFAPIADGVTLVTNPAYQRMNKKIAPVPVMGGTNAQEGRLVHHHPLCPLIALANRSLQSLRCGFRSEQQQSIVRSPIWPPGCEQHVH